MDKFPGDQAGLQNDDNATAIGEAAALVNSHSTKTAATKRTMLSLIGELTHASKFKEEFSCGGC